MITSISVFKYIGTHISKIFNFLNMKTLNQGQVSGFGLEKKNQVFEKITFCAELDSQRSGSSKNKLVETFTMKLKKNE